MTIIRQKGFRLLPALAVSALILKIASVSPAFVERYYTNGVYPVISRTLRFTFGWLPFSMGDVLYFAAGAWLIFKAARFVRSAFRPGLKRIWKKALLKGAAVSLSIYIVFNLFWGLNYSRQGIAWQLALEVKPYGLNDARRLTGVLLNKLNRTAATVDTQARLQFAGGKPVFQKAIAAYGTAAARLPFLSYKNPSIKASLYSRVGHYFGFTGYYNPFTAEAQLKWNIPPFLKPFVTCHEMAHQLGYAKENEANFVAFLAARTSGDVNMRYALYYNLYRYALREVYSRDTALAAHFQTLLAPRVVRDNNELKAYFESTENAVEPYIMFLYDRYLKLNQQQAGVETYNEVVALLIAYAKKMGWQAI